MMTTVMTVTGLRMGMVTGLVTNTRLSFCAQVLSTQQISPHFVPAATLGGATVMTLFLR